MVQIEGENSAQIISLVLMLGLHAECLAAAHPHTAVVGSPFLVQARPGKRIAALYIPGSACNQEAAKVGDLLLLTLWLFGHQQEVDVHSDGFVHMANEESFRPL